MQTKLMVGMLALATQVGAFAAQNKTICGATDDRLPSENPKVARLQVTTAPAGCTFTLIGRVCGITAGHCYSTFEVAQFNTPPSQNGRIQHSEAKDIYNVDMKSPVYTDNGQGDDFAVLRLNANEITGQLPGDVQGHYAVAFYTPRPGQEVRVTGYGADRSDPDRNYAQQTHVGKIYNIQGSAMEHTIDTMGGNSGSSVILESTQEIVGIHTHGGCTPSGGANTSTLIAAHTQLRQAIMDCLRWEEENL